MKDRYNAVWQRINSDEQKAQQEEQGWGGDRGEMMEANMQRYQEVIATHKSFSFGSA